ncbi:phage Gp37/Gp68 family protein [Bradyrhizobium sp.]
MTKSAGDRYGTRRIAARGENRHAGCPDAGSDRSGRDRGIIGRGFRADVLASIGEIEPPAVEVLPLLRQACPGPEAMPVFRREAVMGKSNIEWTERTWNPIVGCSIVSPGCMNCYAMKMSGRLQKMNRTGGSNSNYVNHYDGTTKKVNGNIVWTGKLAMAPDKIFLQPLSRKAPTTYFVNSMGDLFHEDCPDEWIDRVFAVMALSPQHTFQVLTKRAARMREYLSNDEACQRIGEAGYAIWTKHLAPRDPGNLYIDSVTDDLGFKDAVINLARYPLPNVWLGVSAERQQEWDERVEQLGATPAAVRFVSVEPMLGEIDCGNAFDAPPDGSPYRPIDWIICGGESGHGYRPMNPDWARSIRDQCAAAGVAVFIKQMAGKKPIPEDLMVRQFPR